MHPQEIPKFSSNGLDEYISAFAVDAAHLPNVSAKMTKLHKVGEYFLIEIRREYIHCISDRLKEIHEIARNDDVTNPQRRK